MTTRLEACIQCLLYPGLALLILGSWGLGTLYELCFDLALFDLGIVVGLLVAKSLLLAERT